MNKPIDWTKPLETVGRYSARYLGRLRGIGLIYPHVVAITQPSFNEYTASVADDGTWLADDGERIPYIVNKGTKREGWTNIYLPRYANVASRVADRNFGVWKTEAEALTHKSPNLSYLATVKVEWTE